MNRGSANSSTVEAHQLRSGAFWLGIALCAMIAFAAIATARAPALRHLGMSAVTLAILFGVVAGNTFFTAVEKHTATGVDFSKSIVLRVAIVLFGLRITFQQIGAVGCAGVLIDALMVVCTYLIALQLGMRVLRLDRQTSILIGAGSALCGAAAIMATEPVVRGEPHQVSVAVATVVVFGTIAMVSYPLLYPYLSLSEHAYGVFAGSTVHEVAQVVAAGRGVSESAAAAAVIEKMLRIMMLAPFLLILSVSRHSRALYASAEAHSHGRSPMVIPWFAVLFIIASAVNSLQVLPTGLSASLVEIDTVLLATAMAALGVRTRVGAVRQAGVKPLLLAASLFAFLVIGGYAINRAVTHWLG
jgi:uncharacterized integral membrane protein (TIGR00698 family)